MDHRPKLRAETIKILKEDIGEHFCDLELCKGALDLAPKHV